MEKVWSFDASIEAVGLPLKFTFPFYYEPHKLAILAAEQVQAYLTNNDAQLTHNFGLKSDNQGLVIGKMFGVLVVKTPEDHLGFIAAFSGKLADTNEHDYFVPPVFDLLQANSFFKEEEAEINAINYSIENIENDSVYHQLLQEKEHLIDVYQQTLSQHKNEIKQAKQKRKMQREELQLHTNGVELEEKLEVLRQASLKEQYFLKDFQSQHKLKLQRLIDQIEVFEKQLEQNKFARKKQSNELQNKIFQHYSFLNQNHEEKSLLAIFANTVEQKPPAGAGECAAPKLLQYAFLNRLKPICMAEFWWGESPKSEIRVHKQYYPACRGKCEPILSHMLKGIELDENPMLINPAIDKQLEIIYEDEHVLAVNKPYDMLSVPGKIIHDSVYSRVRDLYPKATGPLIVHRLDMSTSGILLLAKDIETYKKLQHQFVKRHVKKRYVALLDGIVEQDSGFIDLPLRLDIDDRPRQLVCFEHGKPAQTQWEVIERVNGRTWVNFYPITGRTHQLRVHAAHPLGLGIPIVGDDLYGCKDERLFLHAESLEFTHPVTKEKVKLEKKLKKNIG